MTRVLLIEDDASLGRTLAERLEREQVTVKWVRTVAEARAELAEAWNLAIVDVTLPDGSGFGLARLIRKGTTTPIMFMTALNSAESRLEGFEIGAEEYLPKPFHLKEFIIRVRLLLARQRPPDPLRASGSIHADFSKFDETVEKLRSIWGMRHICLPFVMGDGAGYPYWKEALTLRATDRDGKFRSISINPHQGTRERERFVSVLRQFVDHLQQKNWLNDSHVWLWDEPHKPELVEQANAFADFFREAAPELRLMLTTRPAPSLSPHIGLFCALANHATDEDSLWCKENGKDYWLYTCGDAQQPSLTVGKPALDSRVFGWIAFRFDAQCVLEWAINRRYERVKWDTEGWRCKALPDLGDGMLFYPPMRKGDPPCPSIRSENLRDGVEDASLLRMAELFRDDPRSGADGRSLIKEAGELVPDQRTYNLQPSAYYLLRNRVGGFIERIQHEAAKP